MKKTIFSIIFFLSFSIVFANYDFRNTKWRMTKEDVMKSETSELEIEEDMDFIIFYKSSLSNYDCRIGYNFYENQLRSARYIFDGNIIFGYGNRTKEMITLYDYFKEILIKKYVVPLGKKEIWDETVAKSDLSKIYNREQFKINPEKFRWWSFDFSVKWETNRTIVELQLMHYSGIGTIFIQYRDKEWFEYIKQEKEQELYESF